MKPGFAIVRRGLEPLDLEQLRRAFLGVPGLAPCDAGTVCNEAGGILCRGFSTDQAAALQANLKTEGVEVEMVDESQLPVLPPPKLIRRVEIKSEALFVEDLIKGLKPIAWDQVCLIAAGSVQLTKFARQQQVTEEIRLHISHGIPLPVMETKLEYRSKEAADWYLRAEIIMADGSIRYSVEAEQFNFSPLGEGVTRDLAGNFCLLIRGLATHAPGALLSRGAASILSEPCEFSYYPRKNAFHDDIIWTLWKAAPSAG